jgi:hypothetical protein
LKELVEAQEKLFEEWLLDNFTDDEIDFYQDMIDSISSVLIDSKIDELKFEDYEAIRGDISFKKILFHKSITTISFSDLPYLENNPFQVSYLTMLLNQLNIVLIDPGGLEDLLLKEEYLVKLGEFKKADDLLFRPSYQQSIVQNTSQKVYDPIDKLVTEIYNELKRLEVAGILPMSGDDLPEKTRKILISIQQDYYDSNQLLALTALHPKDFDDHLEKLKFYLKKVNS